MADRQQHSDSIDIVKQVIRVNKNKTPNFFSSIMLPNRLNPVYRPINYLLQWIADMVIPAYFSSIISSDFKYTFRKNTALRFSDAHRMHSRELIQCNQATKNKCLRIGPWYFVCLDCTKYIRHQHKVFYCGPQILVAIPVRLPNLFHWDLGSLKVFAQLTRPHPT